VRLLKFQIQFDALTVTHGKKLIEEWEMLDTNLMQKNGEWYSVHRLNWSKGEPNYCPSFSITYA
jgi:hypothetical protein